MSVIGDSNGVICRPGFQWGSESRGVPTDESGDLYSCGVHIWR